MQGADEKLGSPMAHDRPTLTGHSGGTSLRGLLTTFVRPPPVTRLGSVGSIHAAASTPTQRSSSSLSQDSTAPTGVSVSGMGTIRVAPGTAASDIRRSRRDIKLAHERPAHPPGVIDFFIAALFDPFEEAKDTGAECDDVPSLALSAFAAGQTPPKRRSRGSSQGSCLTHTVIPTDGQAAPSSADDDAHRRTMLGASSSSAAGAGIRPGEIESITRRVSIGVTSAAINPQVPVLLPQVIDYLRRAPDGVAHLVEGLDARRGDGTVLSEPSFDALCSVMLAALDIADERSDFSRARALMVLSQTFFCYVLTSGGRTALSQDTTVTVDVKKLGAGAEAELAAHVDLTLTSSDRQVRECVDSASAKDKTLMSTPTSDLVASPGSRLTRKLYVQARVKDHHLWQLPAFWESAVFDGVGAEISKAHAEMRDRTEREQDVSFGQLGFFAFNMMSFGVSEAQ